MLHTGVCVRLCVCVRASVCVHAHMHAHKELIPVRMYVGGCKHTVNTDGVGTGVREVCEGPVMKGWGVTERQTDREKATKTERQRERGAETETNKAK